MAQVTEVKETNASAGAEVKSTAKIDVKMITKEELNKRMQGNELMQIVNVLDPQYYNLGFIKGSKRIPLDKLEARLGELDQSKEVITYCAGGDCSASKHAAELLAGKGFRVSVYEGGIKEWKAAGLPTEA